MPFDDVRERIIAGEADVTTAWFNAGPSFEEGRDVVLATSPTLLDSSRPSIVVWAATLTTEQRTQLLLEWIGADANRTPWVGKFGDHGIDEKEFVAELGRRIDDASQAAVREDLARNVLDLRPSSPLAQREVAHIVEGRLKTGIKGDSDVARLLFPALGREHRSASRLNAAIRQADKSGKLKLTEKDRDALRAAKLDAPSRGFPRFGR